MLYCFLAEGFEEIEALAAVDIIRRANYPVTTVGVGGCSVKGAHGITVFADMTEDEFEINEDITGVILPGGMPGVTNLFASETVKAAVSFCAANKLLLCAICAAPSIFGEMGLLKDKKATCFPGFEDKLLGAAIFADKVVKDGNIITAKGAGCALDFGFAIVSELEGKDCAEKIAGSMQCR